MDRNQKGWLVLGGRIITAALFYYEHPGWGTLFGVGTAYGIYDITTTPAALPA